MSNYGLLDVPWPFSDAEALEPVDLAPSASSTQGQQLNGYQDMLLRTRTDARG